MAQKRKRESEIVVSASAAAPARRRTTTSRTARAKRTEVPVETSQLPVETATQPVEVPMAEPAAVVASYQPSHQEIAEAAYSLWLARGCQGGCPEEDWMRAEAQLMARAAGA